MNKQMIIHILNSITLNNRNLRIWSHLLKKSLIENFIFYAVYGLVVSMYFIILNMCL